MKFVCGICCAALLLLSSCGYHVGGKADLMPKSVQTIAVPAFRSLTTDYKFGDGLANAISHEFIERTRFHIVKNPDEADAILHGSINRVIRGPALSDPTTGKITSVTLIVILNIDLTERTTGKVLFSRPALNVSENYEIATDPHQIFDESAPAFVRMSRLLARDIVDSVVENF